MGQKGEENAPCGDKGKLYERKGDRFRKGIQDRLRGGVCEGRRQVPYET